MGVSNVTVIKKEDALKSVEGSNLTMRWLFENDWLEVAALEINPLSTVEESDLCENPSLHFIIEGELAFESSEEIHFLSKGDCICFHEKANYRIINHNEHKGIVYTFFIRSETSHF
ncbi:MAG: hypothetical protein HYR55_07960 [Acidobacteria bacterium]|nr:hypothetical protein [Acidobacteriota bacterium]MBI3658837.1 hypothetical protein [Acidobacteriota bacterium]